MSKFLKKRGKEKMGRLEVVETYNEEEDRDYVYIIDADATRLEDLVVYEMEGSSNGILKNPAITPDGNIVY